MKMRYLLVCLLWLAACTHEPSPPEPTEAVVMVDEVTMETAVSPTSVPTISPTSTIVLSVTPIPTNTPTETSTLVPTPLPTLSIRVSAGTAVPQSNQPITTDNVTQLTELARWGRGVINDISLSGNGRWVAVGTATGVYIHDTEDLSKTVHHLENPLGVEWVAISPDGNMVAASLAGDLMQVWDVDRNQIMYEKELSGYDVSFSPNGEYIALGDHDGIHVLRANDGEIKQIYPGKIGAQFSPEGTELAVWDYTPISIYSWPENKLIDEKYPALVLGEDGSEFLSAIGEVKFMPDGQALASALPTNPNGVTGGVLVQHGSDGNINFEVDPINLLSEPIRTFCNESTFYADSQTIPEPWQMELSLDGEVVAFVFRDIRNANNVHPLTSIRFYEQNTGRNLYNIEEGIEDISLSSNNGTWVAGLHDGLLQIRSLHDGSVLDSVDDYDAPALKTAVSPDSEWVAVEYLNEVKIFQAANGEVAYQYPAQRIAFSPDGEIFALGYDDGRLEIRSLADNQLLKAIFGHDEGITAVAFLPSGELVSAGLDCKLQIWRPADGTSLKMLENYIVEGEVTGEMVPVRVWELAISQDGEFLVGDFAGSIGIWNIEKGDLLNTPDTENYPDNVALFENNMVIAVSPLLIGQIETDGQFSESWEGEHSLNAVEFSPDGEFVVAGMNRHEGALKIFLADNGEILHEIMPVTDDVTGIAFEPNGRYFVSTTIDGVTRLWGIP